MIKTKTGQLLHSNFPVWASGFPAIAGLAVLISRMEKYALYIKCLEPTIPLVGKFFSEDRSGKCREFSPQKCSGQYIHRSSSKCVCNVAGNKKSLRSCEKRRYSWFAHDVISCHWAPSWLTLQITSAVCSEVLVSIYYLIVSFSVL